MRKYPRPLSLDHKMDIHLIAKLNSLDEAWHELFVNGAENRMNIRYGSKTLFTTADDGNAMATYFNVDMTEWGAPT